MLTLVERKVRGLRVSRRMQFRVHDVREASFSDTERPTQVELGVNRIAPFEPELDCPDEAVPSFDKPR